MFFSSSSFSTYYYFVFQREGKLLMQPPFTKINFEMLTRRTREALKSCTNIYNAKTWSDRLCKENRFLSDNQITKFK